jgi:DNA mismatch repair protein MutS
MTVKYLIIDEQTISDLAIFGKPGKPGIYELFNKTITQGAGKKLEELFRHPLSEETLINERAALYRFFSEEEFTFPVDSETISMLAYYMENDDVRSQLTVGTQSIGQRFKGMVAADSDQVFVNDGVQAVLRLFYRLREFIQHLESKVKDSAYEPAFTKLYELFNAAAFNMVRQHAGSRHEIKLQPGILSDIDKQVRFEYREYTMELLHVLYDLDVCIAIGQTARNKGFHFAKAMPPASGALDYQQVYHPHVENAVANNLHLNQSYNILFLTGANMAGKSTLMKSIGVALYLGHMGLPVAAEKFEFAVRDGIYTSINLADNLNAGASHYYAEVLRVKEVARELAEGKQLFVIFDEMFRGTNVKDAYDATIALTSAFCNKRSSQFIISTHIMEAGEILQQRPLSVKYQFLPTEMKGNVPVYTRVLRDGITADRQGMIIIQNEGILEMLDAGIKNQKEELCHS